MNDSSVSLSDIRAVLNQQAYLLFYIRYMSLFTYQQSQMKTQCELSLCFEESYACVDWILGHLI